MRYNENLIVEIVETARSLYQRGYSFGTAGNISVRASDRIYITPTNSCFGALTVETMSELDLNGNRLSGNVPSKETHFHLSAYRARPEASAVVHLHSTYATAVSCLRELDMEDALPIFTPYFAMRIPKLPVVPYLPPGDPMLAPEVERCAAVSPAMLLRNHGPITTGKTLIEAAALSEELEEQSKLYFLLNGAGQQLTIDEVAELRRRFR
ncbi:MAG: aldolase [Acidimicrobiia bacterium]|nr:aldolase [Acidimicrobiia bacterium]